MQENGMGGELATRLWSCREGRIRKGVVGRDY